MGVGTRVAMHTILLVDDEKNMLISLNAILRDEGYEVEPVSSAEEALKIMEEKFFNLIISDLKMEGMSGLDLLEKVKLKNPSLPLILITAYATPKSAVEAIKSGAFDYIQKPFEPEEILFSIRRALDFFQMQKENLNLKKTLHERQALDEIIGEDPGIAAVRQMIQAVAPTQATVLIEGDSGTGKELVAKAIHELSTQSSKGFFPVNCAAIPDPLLESELFGHEKGAFTGAHTLKKGKFEAAHGGTLYLDEIGDMSLGLQAKILRVLEDGKFQRVGATESIHSDARIVAATNKDLKKAIQAGTFREDLYFRINVISIKLPPLRERITDLSFLIQNFIRRFNIIYNKNIQDVEPEALKILSTYHWPGNIRELRNIMERAVLLEKNDFIQAKSFPAELLQKNKNGAGLIPLSDEIDFKNTVEGYEKQLIQWALQKNKNRISLSAKALGLSRHSLRHYLLKYFKSSSEFEA